MPSDSTDAKGASDEPALDSITTDTERVRATFSSPDGLTRIAGDEERHVSVSVVMVVTDERILFVEGTHDDLGAAAGALAYDDLAAVGIEGWDPAVLALSMANGVRWEFPLPDADPDLVNSVVRHLRWIGQLRSRLVACRNDLELAAGQIHDAADAMEWDDAEAVYETHRDRLDRLICAVQLTAPIDDSVVAPELTEMERTLERAYARSTIEHAQSRLELGQQLVENEEYDQARTVLQTAQERYERASGRADAVERGDAFRFGEQRELREELDRLEWEIEAVAAEPIRRAHEAKLMAKNAGQTAVAVDHWETAFRRYGNVLTLDWGSEGRNFAGDPENIRAEMQNAAVELVACHCDLAREKWNEGVTLERNDAVKAALRACTDATEHLDRAAELASEFQPDAVTAIERRRDGMRAAIREIRDTATVEHEGESVEGDSVETGKETKGEQSGSESEGLLDLDTHQEITFDATVEEGAADGGRRHRQGFNDTATGNEGERDDPDRGDGDSETLLHSEE